MNRFRTILIVVLFVCNAFCVMKLDAEENVWDFKGDLEDGAPAGWKPRGSNPEICQWVQEKDGAFALALVDQDEDNWGQWTSSSIRIPSDSTKIELTAEIRYQIQAQRMRVSCVFYDAGKEKIGVANQVLTGASPEFEKKEYEVKSWEVSVPEGSVRMLISFASGGDAKALGELYVRHLVLNFQD